MPLPIPFNPQEDLPTLKQRFEWMDSGLLPEDGTHSIQPCPLVDYEYEIWPLYKEPTEEEVEHTVASGNDLPT